MRDLVSVEKDPDHQKPIPSAWRRNPVTESQAAAIRRDIEAYGARLIHLPQEAWDTSACQWMKGYRSFLSTFR